MADLRKQVNARAQIDLATELAALGWRLLKSPPDHVRFVATQEVETFDPRDDVTGLCRRFESAYTAEKLIRNVQQRNEYQRRLAAHNPRTDRS